MRKLQNSVLVIGIVLFGLGGSMAQQTSSASQEKDRAAIQQTLDRFLDAWNKHDARAFAMTFTDDCDFTNVHGVHVHGRAGTEALHARIFATVFKQSHQTAQIRSIRFLSPGLAAVDVDWQMTGSLYPNGKPRPERRGLVNWVMAKQSDGSWLIAVMHNTELTGHQVPRN